MSAVVFLACVSAVSFRGQSPERPAQPALAKGVVIPSVSCEAKPEQSYALFLPSAYAPERQWPIVYAFDPAARGSLPVGLLKDTAEQYGYIVAGSNNSRNGPHQAQLDAAQAMWEDTHKRFAIDDRRVYLTGFSGGARAATLVALMCDGCAAGVMAHGAGFPALASWPPKIAFHYFAAIGELDFNYPEMVELAQRLDKQGVVSRLRRFPGPHQWAPAELWTEAIEWMELLAMKHGRRPKDSAFIARQFARGSQRAAQWEQAGEVYFAYEEYGKLAQEFEGLTDVSLFVRKVAALGESADVRAGGKRQKEEIRRQRMLTKELSEALLDMRTAQPELERSAELHNRLRLLQAESKKVADPATAKIARRALSQIFAQAYEAGEQSLRESNFALAARYFDFAAAAEPTFPGPFFQLARAYARSGAKKKALRALAQAADNGLRAATLLRYTDEFSLLENEKDFRAILERVKRDSP